MSFLEDVDSIKAKAHLGAISPLILVGLTAIVLVIGFFVLNGFFHAAQGATSIVKSESSQSASASTAGAASAKIDVYVYVVGAVRTPGVYGLVESARVKDAIDAAGGFTEEAATTSLNLARVVVDGEQITVPNQNAVQQTAQANEGGAQAAAGISIGSGIAADGKININTANLEQLKTLKGVGDATAQKIIDSRETEGPFKTIEELKRVSGIGDKKYAALANSITVG